MIEHVVELVEKKAAAIRAEQGRRPKQAAE